MPAEADASVTPQGQGVLHVDPARLAALVGSVLHATGLARSAADCAAAALVDADCAGLPSHGVMLVPMYVERLRAGSVSLASEARVISDGGSTIVLDAGHALGQLTSRQAVGLLAERAPLHGVAAVAVRNAFHFGAAGYWAAALAREGLAGVAMSNTRPLMPAPGGAERVVGNNPLAIAVPGAEDPIIFDMATSAGAMGKIRLAAAAGAAIPAGWATDGEGTPTMDAAQAIQGMLLPAGGPKGFGLALMIDLLCGGLASGALGDAVRPLYGHAHEPYGCAHFFLAIDVGHFRDLPEFTAAVAAFAQGVRASKVAPGVTRVAMPGDRAHAARRANRAACPLPADVARALDRLAAALGIADRLLH